MSDMLNRYLMASDSYSEFLMHHGVKGQKWGVRHEKEKVGREPAASYDTVSPERRTALKKELKKLSKGGRVDLANRPVIDARNLVAAGWKHAGSGKATVFSSTYSDRTGRRAANFTPIVVRNGKAIGIVRPRDLQRYAEDVIEGRRRDNLGLQMGKVHKGRGAIKSATTEAQYIHELHDEYFLGGSQKKSKKK